MLNRPNCPTIDPECSCAQHQNVIDVYLQLLQRRWFTAEDMAWWATVISAADET